MELGADAPPDGSSDLTPVAMLSSALVKRVTYNHKLLVDSREQRPYTFEFVPCDSKDAGSYLDIFTERTALKHGDYAISGYPSVVVERKSLVDLYGSISQRRANFESRLQAMQDELRFAAIVVEAEWSELLRNPPKHSKFTAKSLFRSIVSWMQRYPRVHWIPCLNRRMAEIVTFRVLDRGRQDQEAGKVEERAESSRSFRNCPSMSSTPNTSTSISLTFLIRPSVALRFACQTPPRISEPGPS